MGSPTFDLEAYARRIGAAADGAADLPTLEALHVAHLDRVPFENVDVFLGRPSRLDLPSLAAKLVLDRRGGYCFEQNALFAAALRALGFDVRTLEARVRPVGETALLPRTHMVLRVEIAGRSYLADVGFGADGPLVPVPLDGTPSEQPDAAYRIEREGPDLHVLRRQGRAQSRDLYAFRLAPAEPIDFEVAHWFTSTHPSSPFVQTLTVQRRQARVRRILRGRSYLVRRGDDETVREIVSRELGSLLEDDMGLVLGRDLLAELTEAFDHLPPFEPPPR